MKSSAASSSQSLESLALTRAERIATQQRREASKRPLPDVLDFVPAMSGHKGYVRPEHFAPVADLVRNFRTQPFEACFAAPPRHGKTEFLEHIAVWVLKQCPSWNVGYITYQAELAHEKSSDIYDIALKAGVEMKRMRQPMKRWRTKQRGGLIATGIGGPITGRPLNFAIVDDSYKNRAEAESPRIRAKIFSWFQSTLYTRLEPGASVLVMGTRWHDDDLQGNLIRGDVDAGRRPWRNINLQAIFEGGLLEDGSPFIDPNGRRIGEALWPGRWPLELLNARRPNIGEYDFASLYQGRPRPAGSTVFDGADVYDELPRSYRVGIGIDLAYSAKTEKDWSIAVVGYYDPRTDLLYIVDCIRRQGLKAPEFKGELALLRQRFRHARWRFYAAPGPESGSADFIRVGSDGIPNLQVIHATTDKKVRALSYAASWNSGRVLLPSDDFIQKVKAKDPKADFEWVKDFLRVHKNFTGLNDRWDDDVDAGAAMHDLLVPPRRNPGPIPLTPVDRAIITGRRL